MLCCLMANPIRMTKHNLIALFILGIISISGCSKNHYSSKIKVPDFYMNDVGRMLINKKWMEVSIEVIQTDTLSKDITGQFMKSDLDDIIVFSEDGTYEFDEGKTKARNESSQIYQKGIWRINEQGEILFFDANGKATSYYIKEISSDKIILTLPVKNKNYYYLMTYKVI